MQKTLICGAFSGKLTVSYYIHLRGGSLRSFQGAARRRMSIFKGTVKAAVVRFYGEPHRKRKSPQALEISMKKGLTR